MLISRSRETVAVEALLQAVREGQGRCLVVSGEPGIGKTALVEYALGVAKGLRVVHARVAESEHGLAFSGLSLVVARLADNLDALAEPQRRALEIALRMRPPSPIDRFAAYAGLLSLLAAAAEQQPLLVALDDAHWLDISSAHALAFVARRLDHDGIGLLLAARPAPGWVLDGVEALELVGLDARGADELIGTASRAVAERLCTATAGNPLALIELTRLLNERQLAGREPLPEPLPVGANVAAEFGRQIGTLPAATRRALLFAAADDRPPAATLARALSAEGLAVSDLAPAETASLISLDAGLAEFRHPLVRAAAYHCASAPERRAAHRAMAAALGTDTDRERRAWHLAAAAIEPDETVAAELEAAAAEARTRGAPAAAAHALQAAARLSPEAGARANRLIAAAEQHSLAGAPETAVGLLDEGLALAGEKPLTRARIQHVRVWANMMRGAPVQNAELLRREADRVRPFDARQATVMDVEAAWLDMMAGHLHPMLHAVEATLPAASELGGEVYAAAAWALGAAHLLGGDYAEGCRLCDQAAALAPSDLGLLGSVAARVGQYRLWREEHEPARDILIAILEAARSEGAVFSMPYILAALADAEFRLGRWQSAYANALQSLELAGQTGQAIETLHSCCQLAEIEGAMGFLEAGRTHGELVLERAHEAGVGGAIPIAGRALGLLELGAGRYDDAISRLDAAGRFALERGLAEPAVVPWAQDLAEAYVRVGDPSAASRTLVVLDAQAARTGGLLPRAAAERCRGLLVADPAVAEAHFARALDLHRQRDAPFELARTELCRGERLRRDGQRSLAREQLGQALERFTALGARPWEEHTRRELDATGLRTRARVPSTADQLTPQELQVALLVADGSSNREAAATLFVSPRTVETHLQRIYRKAGVHSRVQLARALRLGQVESSRASVSSVKSTPSMNSASSSQSRPP